MNKTIKNRLWFIGKLLFSSSLMFLLYRKIPLDDFRTLLNSVDLLVLPPILLLLFLNTAASALKWRLFLLADGIDISFSTLTVTYLIGSFYNLFLPSNIGGDSYRIYDIAQKSKSGVRSAASVLADRFSGFLALVILSLVSSMLVARQFDNLFFFFCPLLILLFLVAVLIAFMKEQPVRLFMTITRLTRFPLLVELTEKFFLSIKCYRADQKLFIKVMAISFAFQLSVCSIVWLLALSLHSQVSFIYFTAFVPLITLLEALPISIFGLGLRDVGYVFFFSWTGMTELQSRLLALLFFAIAVGYSLIGGLAYLGRTVYGAVKSEC